MIIIFLILSALSGDEVKARLAEFIADTKGIKYVYGKTDCSWLVKRWFNYLGLYIPRGSWLQYEYLKTQGWIETSTPEELGLFFFKGSNPRAPKDRISHVGIVVEHFTTTYWLTYEARRYQGIDFYLREFPHPKWPTLYLCNPKWKNSG